MQVKRRAKILALLRRSENVKARFWPNVLKTSKCWVWTAYTDSNGYGVMSFWGYPIRCHTVSYFLRHGTLPRTGRELDHKCRNRNCVRPGHLEDVTHKINIQRGANATKTSCVHGHPYNAANTLVSGGVRFCRTCARIKSMKIKRAAGVLPRVEWFAKRLQQPKYSKTQKEDFVFPTKPSKRSKFRKELNGGNQQSN